MTAMPNELSLLTEEYGRAISELEKNLFSQVKMARRLSDAEIQTSYKGSNFSAGWQIEYESYQGKAKLNFLITRDFPFDHPSIGFAVPPNPLTYPHIESNGVLCLLSNADSFSPNDPSGVARYLFTDAYNLLEDCFTGKNIEDFRREFHSYWNRNLTVENLKFVSLLKPQPPSRIIKVWRGNNKDIFGENESSLQKWLENRLNKKNHTFESAAFLWLYQPLLPSEYPKNNYDLWEIVENRIEGGKAILEKLSSKSPNQLSVLLGSQSELGPCLAGVTIRKPKSCESEYFREKFLIEKGFQPGRTPGSVITTRYLQSSSSVNRYAVERADKAWIHGRGEDVRQQNLSLKKVAILGCGSIGGFVAKLLATSGVGHLTFIDPENLSWANTGRHFLGAKYVGFSKAQKLAEELRDNYPHLHFDFRINIWSNINRKEPELLGTNDLIISTIGDWSAESMLNEWQQNLNNPPPIIYGWTEPFALAGHSVATLLGKGCLRCHLNEFGKTDLSVTNWKGSETLRQEPACGVMFQPYGPVELNNTVNIITELVLDVLLGRITTSTERLWACRQSLLEPSGGSWTEEWLDLVNNNTQGGFSANREWSKINTCPSCQNKEI